MADVTLYDYNGRPIQKSNLTRELAAPSMTGIRRIWNDTVASGLTPQRLASLLMDASQGNHNSYLTLAEEMEERDLHYACELGKRKLAVSSLPITIESATDDTKDVEIADAVRSLVKKAGFRMMLKDMLDGLGKGFSVVEILWDRSSSIWTPKGYEWRDPHWFRWDIDSLRKVRLLDVNDMAFGIDLEPYKFIVHTPRIKSGIPIRSGFARLAAWAYMCKGYTIKDWLAFAEVFGMPIRMGKYGPGTNEDDIDILKMAVANLGSDAAAVFPEGMTIELVEASKSGSTDFFERLAQYLDNQVTKGILGQTATTQGTPGKLGNEDAQAEVREDIRDDDAFQLCDTLQRDLIIPFVGLNFGPQANYPSILLQAPEKEDIDTLVNALEKLVPLGLRVEQSVVRDRLRLPDPDDGADVLMPAQSQPVPAIAPAINHARALNRMTTQDQTDQEVSNALGDWRPLMQPVIDPIQAALSASESPEEFEQHLTQIFENQDIEEITKSLALAFFKSKVDGLSDGN